MFEHENIVALLAFIAILNIFTGVILYREEQKMGITVDTGNRRRSIMICTTMCILSGSIALGIMLYDIMSDSYIPGP